MVEGERIEGLRRAYARELTELAELTHAPLIEAFAVVPRERFLGPGPWTIYGAGFQESRTPDDDPAHIYRNVLVSLDAAKKLNNGEPRFWAGLFERLKPRSGERAIHVGTGTGYYTAMLAQMVGASGQVTGIEYEPDLAQRARANLAPWPQAELLTGDGMALAARPADLIIASCGFDQVPVGWVRLLRDGGRLLVPLTATMPDWPGGGWGANLMVTRQGDRYRAAWAGGVGIYHSMSGRSPTATARLKAAFDADRARGDSGLTAVASLRLDDALGESCWLAGEGWWLSTDPP